MSDYYDNDEGSVYKAFTDFALALVVVLLMSIATIKAKNVDSQAEYLATIEWDAHEDVDIDLLTKVNTEDEKDKRNVVYYGSKSYNGIYLDRDSRGFSSDKIKVKGEEKFLPHKEVVSIRGSMQRDLVFGIHFFAHKDINAKQIVAGSNVPMNKDAKINVHFEFIKINPETKVVYTADKVLNAVGDSDNMLHVSLNADEFKILELPINPVADDLYFQHSATAHPTSSGGYTPGGGYNPVP